MRPASSYREYWKDVTRGQEPLFRAVHDHTRRLSISAPPALSSLYADSDGDQRGFPQHGHDRALGKSLKMDSVAAINEQVPTPVVGQGFLGDPGPCRFPPKPTLVRISFPAT